MSSECNRQAVADMANLAVIGDALKALCREAGVERDRKQILQIANLLTGLWREGIRERGELVKAARELLTETTGFETMPPRASSP